MYKIWFIDDREDNRQAWLNGFPEEIRQNCELRVFAGWKDLKKALDENYIPDILFIDFFLGDIYGGEVVEWIKNNVENSSKIVLIAHSSMESANKHLVNMGVDCSLAKNKGIMVSDTIAQQFKSLVDVEFLVKNKKLN